LTKPSVLENVNVWVRERLIEAKIEELEKGFAIHPENKLRVAQLRLALEKTNDLSKKNKKLRMG
jgi:hypothetical protein